MSEHKDIDHCVQSQTNSTMPSNTDDDNAVSSTPGPTLTPEQCHSPVDDTTVTITATPPPTPASASCASEMVSLSDTLASTTLDPNAHTAAAAAAAATEDIDTQSENVSNPSPNTSIHSTLPLSLSDCIVKDGYDYREHDTALTKVFIGGLAWTTGSASLHAHFEQYGEIIEAVVIKDRVTGHSKGYGFITFATHASASAAIQDPKPVIDGRETNCNIAAIGATSGTKRKKKRRGKGSTTSRHGKATVHGQQTANGFDPHAQHFQHQQYQQHQQYGAYPDQLPIADPNGPGGNMAYPHQMYAAQQAINYAHFAANNPYAMAAYAAQMDPYAASAAAAAAAAAAASLAQQQHPNQQQQMMYPQQTQMHHNPAVMAAAAAAAAAAAIPSPHMSELMYPQSMSQIPPPLDVGENISMGNNTREKMSTGAQNTNGIDDGAVAATTTATTGDSSHRGTPNSAYHDEQQYQPQMHTFDHDAMSESSSMGMSPQQYHHFQQQQQMMMAMMMSPSLEGVGPGVGPLAAAGPGGVPLPLSPTGPGMPAAMPYFPMSHFDQMGMPSPEQHVRHLSFQRSGGPGPMHYMGAPGIGMPLQVAPPSMQPYYPPQFSPSSYRHATNGSGATDTQSLDPDTLDTDQQSNSHAPSPVPDVDTEAVAVAVANTEPDH
jgi:RNA-binding protein 24/38